jgi:hypothetical protein
MVKKNTYEIVTICMGEKSILFRTSNRKSAKRFYSQSLRHQIFVRLQLNGELCSIMDSNRLMAFSNKEVIAS